MKWNFLLKPNDFLTWFFENPAVCKRFLRYIEKSWKTIEKIFMYILKMKAGIAVLISNKWILSLVKMRSIKVLIPWEDVLNLNL